MAKVANHRRRTASPARKCKSEEAAQSVRRRACLMGAWILHAIEAASALAIALLADGSEDSLCFSCLLVLLWSTISSCACSKQGIVGGIIASVVCLPNLPLWGAWLFGSLGFTAAIGAASIRIPYASERSLMCAVSRTLGAISTGVGCTDLLWQHEADGRSSGIIATPTARALRLFVQGFCLACVAAVEVAMLPGAALSIVATAALTALGGDFDHFDECDAHHAPRPAAGMGPEEPFVEPLVVLLHGHRFNAAMWGRYVVSLALAKQSTLAVNYERDGILMNAAARGDGLAELAAVAASELAAKVRARKPRKMQPRRAAGAGGAVRRRPIVFVGHSLGGLVGAYLAAHDGAGSHSLREMGVDVRGLIAISTPFGGVHFLDWLKPHLPWMPACLRPTQLILDFIPRSAACAELHDAIQRHMASGGTCSYRCISGACDPVVRPHSAFALAPSGSSSMHCTRCLANEGHFTITMSDRLISIVVAWTAEMLKRPSTRTAD